MNSLSNSVPESTFNKGIKLVTKDESITREDFEEIGTKLGHPKSPEDGYTNRLTNKRTTMSSGLLRQKGSINP